MSRLARKVAVTTLLLLGLQFVGSIALQKRMSNSLRAAMVGRFYSGIEGSGLLTDCAARPGPWSPPETGWAVWPVSTDGLLVGANVPFRQVDLPAPGQIVSLTRDEMFGEIYASTSPGCGGIVHVLQGSYPVVEDRSGLLVVLATLRILLAVLVAAALVALTAVPLVRRIRSLSGAMGRVVESGFDGEIEDSSSDELGDVARAFNAAAASVREQLERLEHRDAVLRRALADFAHDLRTPLTTLQLSVSGLPASEASSRMRSELSYLQGMMQNFESVLGGEEGEVVTVALDRLLERVQHRFAPLASDRNLSFNIALPDDPLHTRADPVAVERAVSNLVHNALRFADAHVVLLLFREGDEVRLEVRDDGPGFGPSLRRAAERGVRGADGAGVGFGLGLAIAEAAARRFGGRLELRNDEDGSTLAAIVLPVVSRD